MKCRFFITVCLLIIFSLSSNAQQHSSPDKQSLRDSINARIQRSEQQKDTVNLIKYTVQKIDHFGLDTVGINRVFTNNMIYELIFKHSDDLAVLKKASKWMKQIIDTEVPTPEHYDTYANLLYKAGEKKNAIVWQQKAIDLAPNDLAIKGNFEKMKKGQPTWD